MYSFSIYYQIKLGQIIINRIDQHPYMNIVYFTRKWPRHSYNGTLERAINLIESFANMNHKIVLCSDDDNIKAKQQLKEYPIQLLEISSTKISNSLNNINKKNFKPSMFLFDSVQSQQKYSAYLYNRWNKCPRVLDIPSLQKLQKWRKNIYKLIPNTLIPPQSLLSPQNPQQLFSQQQKRSISRSDYILTSNQHNYHLINKYLLNSKGNKYISNINYSFPMEQFVGEIAQLEYRPWRNRKNFVYFGNFDNQSNCDALFVLLSMLWGKVRDKVGDCQLHVWGTDMKNISGIIEQLGKDKLKSMGVYFKGVMSQLQKLSQYKALLNPCIFSTGPHIKTIQSWFMHLPVVTTPIGSQSLYLESYNPQLSLSDQNNRSSTFISQRTFTPEQNKKSQKIRTYYNNNKIVKGSGFVFGGSYQNFTIADFVDSAVRMYNDEGYWNACLSNGHKIVRKNYNQGHLDVLIKKAFVQVQIAAYEGRARESYESQWKRYSKSHQFNKKLRT